MPSFYEVIWIYIRERRRWCNHPVAGIGLARALHKTPGCFSTPLLFLSFLTVFQRGRVDLSTGRARPGPVEGLDHHPVLGKLLEVVQGIHLAVPRRLHLHDAVLAVAARAVFPVADLVASDDPILQLLLRSLRGTLLPS